MVARCQNISMRRRNRGKVASELDTVATISHHQLLWQRLSRLDDRNGNASSIHDNQY